MAAKKEHSKKQEPVLSPGVAWRPGSVGVLPVFRGFTVDARLREFRKVDRAEGFVVFRFDSAEGALLLADYRDHGGEL